LRRRGPGDPEPAADRAGLGAGDPGVAVSPVSATNAAFNTASRIALADSGLVDAAPAHVRSVRNNVHHVRTERQRDTPREIAQLVVDQPPSTR